MSDQPMKSAERAELIKLIRLQSKVRKDQLSALGAAAVAKREEELSAQFKPTEDAWCEIVAEAERSVREADAKIQELSRIKGIPDDFRPKLKTFWIDRGENAMKERRAELRRTAAAQITAAVKLQQNAEDQRAAGIIGRLIGGLLETSEARAFLEEMPTLDDLVGRMTVIEVAEPYKQLMGGRR